MFKERLISGIVILAGIVILILVGGLPLWIASMVAACVGLFELYKVAGLGTDRRTWIAYPVTVAYYLLCSRIGSVIVYFTAAVLVLMTIFVAAYPRIRFSGWQVIIIGIFYVGVLSSCLFLTRSSADIFYSWLILLSSWGADTAAYCAGKLLGKHHPFPTLSPKKSVEGCIGGLAGAAILGTAVALIMHRPVLSAIFLAVIGAVFSIIGDLCASAFKRQHGAKDYGNIIPGHGGVLDRFDSMLFTGAVIYICVTFLY